MTEEQYKKYAEIRNEIAPITWFLSWCGDRYASDIGRGTRFELVVKAKNFFLRRRFRVGSLEDNTIELPYELQQRIVKAIEDWVEEKEQEMKEV